MSELITHTAFFNDVASLMPYRHTLHKDFIDSVKQFPDFGAIATATRGNHLYAVPLLEKAEGRKGNPKYTIENQKSISAAVGWLMHRAIDLVSKPLSLKRNAAEIPSPEFSGQEGELVQDAVSFQHILDSGEGKTVFGSFEINPYLFSENFQEHPLGSTLLIEKVEGLFSQLVTSEMLGIFYKIKDGDSSENYIREFQSGFQESTEKLELYTKAVSGIPEKKKEVYLDRINYYDLQDRLIKLTQKVKKQAIDPMELEKALQGDEPKSAYSLALEKGFHFLDHMNNYYIGKIDKEALYDGVENMHGPHRI